MEKYVLITWPDSQILMEKEWFDECILMNDAKKLDDIGSSAYFVPEDRYYSELFEPKYDSAGFCAEDNEPLPNTNYGIDGL